MEHQHPSSLGTRKITRSVANARAGVRCCTPKWSWPDDVKAETLPAARCVLPLYACTKGASNQHKCCPNKKQAIDRGSRSQ